MQGQPLPPPDQLNVLADDTLTTISSSAKYIPETTVILPEIKVTWALFKASRLVFCFIYLDCILFNNNLVVCASILKCNPFSVVSVKTPCTLSNHNWIKTLQPALSILLLLSRAVLPPREFSWIYLWSFLTVETFWTFVYSFSRYSHWECICYRGIMLKSFCWERVLLFHFLHLKRWLIVLLLVYDIRFAFILSNTFVIFLLTCTVFLWSSVVNFYKFVNYPWWSTTFKNNVRKLLRINSYIWRSTCNSLISFQLLI